MVNDNIVVVPVIGLVTARTKLKKTVRKIQRFNQNLD